MTFRQLIEEIKRLDLVDEVATKLTNHNSKTVHRIIQELYDLPGDDELVNCVIVIDNVESELLGIKETIVDVCLLEDQTKWSIDLVDWSSLIDLKIQDNVCNTLTDRLCNVLYEITFWGTTNAAINQQMDEMQSVDDSNLITVTLEDLLQEE